jgi:hypothetical protein
VRLSLRAVVGAVEGLLLARLVALLFAARPDNLVIQMLLWLTAPLVWPWHWFDRWVGQPSEGARLELATLAAIATVALVSGFWSMYRSRRERSGKVEL